MSIPPVSNLNIAASIAGTDRAAGAEIASSQAKGGAAASIKGAADPVVEQAEKVSKSDLSGDSDADGRQMLDTFERRNSESPEDQNDGKGSHDESKGDSQTFNGVIVNRPTLGGHIDLCG